MSLRKPPRRSRRLRLALAIALAISAPAALARETLLLDLRVNGASVDGIITAEMIDDGRILVPASAWRAARLRPPGAASTLSDGSEAYALDLVPGLEWRLDRNGLQLEIQAPAAAFESRSTSLGRGERPLPVAPPPGVYLDYDAYANTDSHGAVDAGALGELVAFGRAGALVHGFAWRREGTGTGDDRWLRTETFFQRDLPGRMQTVVIGDAISSTGGWSRPARYAGLRFARDFSIAPGFITWPMPTIAGSAALPSTVDLLVNQRRQGSESVPAGPFELTDVPVANGAGELQLVVTDLLGRETVLRQDYYVAPGLLAVGLSDFSHEIGWLRRGYGSEDDRYDEAFAASSYRRGIRDWLTVGGRVEWQRERQAAGLGIGLRVGLLGVVGGSLAHSRGDAGDGSRMELSAQRITRRGGLSLRWSRADEDFRDFGSLDGSHRVREEVQLSFGRRLGQRVQFGAHATHRTTWDGERFRIAGLQAGVNLRSGAYVSAEASKRLDDHGWAGSLRISMPLGARRSVLATVGRREDGDLRGAIEARQGFDAGPSWAWRVGASSEASQRLQADLARRHDTGEWSVESRAGESGGAVRLGARGAVGRVAVMGFAARRIDRGAFAVVQVGDFADVPVSLSHQVVARTNADGRALVTGLLPYQLNRLSLDAAQLPLEARVDGDRAELVPYARSGAFLAFPVRRVRETWLVLEREDGSAVPEGARIRLGPGLAEFTVARRGEASVSGLRDGSQLEVRWKDGACRVRIDGRLLAPTGVRTAPLPCKETR